MSQRGFRGRGRPAPYKTDRPKTWRQNQPGSEGAEQYKQEDGLLGEKRSENVSPFKPVGGAGIEVPLGGEADNGAQGEGGPTPKREKKFSNKARLFVGNLPRDTSDAKVRELFEPFGEVHEVFLQTERNFGFVRMV